MTTSTTPMVRRIRIGLVVFGIALLAIGGVTLMNDVNPKRYLGIAIWFLGALIIHDGIIGMAVFGISVIMRRAGRRIPLAVIAIVQGALVIAAIVAAFVVPEIIKKSIGTLSSSILPLDYLGNLGLFYAGLAVVTIAVTALYLVLAKRAKLRPSISQA